MKSFLTNPSLWLGLVFSHYSASSLAEDYSSREEMTVEGERIPFERTNVHSTGKSIWIKPQDGSRFDADQLLKKESSLSFQDTGRISPSGFVIPRIRGQDAKLSDIYIEDIKLSDPYSGLPLVEDLDLRAFGAMELNTGLSPSKLASTNPIGSLRYRFVPLDQSQAKLGLTLGNPYGQSLWSTGIKKGLDSEFRYYGRIHQTQGQYSYYSDEGTPYNSQDDRYRDRQNNDQSSWQVLPYYRQDYGSLRLELLSWLQKANRGIPQTNARLTSSARDFTESQLALIKLGQKQETNLLFDEWGWSFHTSIKNDDRETIDPENLVMNSSKQARMKIRTLSAGGELEASYHESEVKLWSELAHSEIAQSFEGQVGTELNRAKQENILALSSQILPQLHLSTKFGLQTQRDDFGLIQGVVLSEESTKTTRERKSYSENISLGFGTNIGAYAQYGRHKRLPSLYEEFGNGSTVRPNISLKAETLEHSEIGVFWRKSDFTWEMSAYNDKLIDKIIIVPILASASKALNISSSKIAGIESSASLAREQSQWTFSLSVTRARNGEGSNRDKLLPGIAERTLVSEWRQRWLKSFTTHLSSRYRSEVYRDVSNSVKLPSLVLYDANLDYQLTQWEFGLAVKNLLNTRDISIASGSSSGKTGISDFGGSPLPGRQWIITLSKQWKAD